MTTARKPPAPFAVLDGEVFPFICPPRPEAPEIPMSPPLSDPFTPTTTDLVTQAAHMMALAENCVVTAEAFQPNNPFATIGAMRVLTAYMHRWLAARLAAEERELLLTDRLRYEEQQQRAHDHAMATDAEYADEFEDEDEVPHE